MLLLGCTSTYQLLQQAFPSANCLKWTGEQKNEAIHKIAQHYNYMILSSVLAPQRCFQEVIFSANGKTAKAIILDSSVSPESSNIGDISQAVIEALGGIPRSGHIILDKVTYSEMKTFLSPF